MRSTLATQIGVILAATLSCCALSRAQSAAPNVARGRLPRVWSVDKPLFEELMSDQPMGRAMGGALAWRHDEGHVEFGLHLPHEVSGKLAGSGCHYAHVVVDPEQLLLIVVLSCQATRVTESPSAVSSEY